MPEENKEQIIGICTECGEEISKKEVKFGKNYFNKTVDKNLIVFRCYTCGHSMEINKITLEIKG